MHAAFLVIPGATMTFGESARTFAHREDDSAELQLEKATILLVSSVCCVAGCVWSAMYFALFGLGLTMALPILFVAIVAPTIILSARMRDHRPLVYAQLFCITWISALLEWSIGGIGDAGLVICWSFLGPIGALMFLPFRQATYWMFMFLMILTVTIAFDGQLSAHALPVSPLVRKLFFAMNVGTPAAVVFAAASYFVKTTQLERGKSEKLLLNILPVQIARRLKDDSAVIADDHPEVSVLFADIVGFTSYSATVPPDRLVSDLNRIFRRFDVAALRHGVEKIKTIGDAYMVASGIPVSRPDHAQAIADLALELRDVMGELTKENGSPFSLRIGIHSGPVVAGVIGSTKFAYDLWGDTVNTASRMESHGEAGCIQVSERTAQLLSAAYHLEDVGFAEVKGKGRMRLFHLHGRLPRGNEASARQEGGLPNPSVAL